MKRVKAINFRRTDEMGVRLTSMIKEYFRTHDMPLGKKELRDRRTKLFLAIEKGAARIAVAKVRRR